MKHPVKWKSTIIYIHLETGEIIDKYQASQLKLHHKEKTAEYLNFNKTKGLITWIHFMYENPQIKLPL